MIEYSDIALLSLIFFTLFIIGLIYKAVKKWDDKNDE
jgi:hypothetical protein